jgi:nitrite reductase (NO-forming)
MAGINKSGFIYRNANYIKSIARIAFGFVWLIDAYFKFQPGFAQNFSNLIQSGGQGQPGWLAPWFAFWVNFTSFNPAAWAYIIAFSELAVAISLILGFMRRVGYSGGFVLSLLIWSVPEGFGGPYGPSSTDIGTAIIYAIVFLMLIVINAEQGTSRYSLDYYIERKWKWWKKVAEFNI